MSEDTRTNEQIIADTIAIQYENPQILPDYIEAALAAAGRLRASTPTGDTAALAKYRAEDMHAEGDLAAVVYRDHADALADALEVSEAERATLAAQLDALHSWDGLIALLDEHWPTEFLPTLPDDDKRDPGPRIVSLLRWLASERAERATLEAVITDAPHDERCAHFSYTHPRPDCDCWKSLVGDPVVLREHDAKVLRDAAESWGAGPAAREWLHDRADAVEKGAGS